MGSRGYLYETVGGKRYRIPEPEVLLSPVRGNGSEYPTWLVEFASRSLLYFRKSASESAAYSLAILEDGSCVFTDVEIDTTMYTMTRLNDGYVIEWEQYTTDNRPDWCDEVGDVILPTDDSGSEWVEFTPDFTHLVLEAYEVNEDAEPLETDDSDEDSDEEETPKYYVDITFAPEESTSCSIWDVETEERLTEFTLARGEYDTRHRRVYGLGGIDHSVLFGDGGFSVFDDAGDRVGGASRYEYEDDDGYDDGWGMDTLSNLAFDEYAEEYGEDLTRKNRTVEFKRKIWDAAVENEETPIGKFLLMLRMALDAELTFRRYSWSVDVPENYRRVLSGGDMDGWAVHSAKRGWELRDPDGETKYEVAVHDSIAGASWVFRENDTGREYTLGPVGDGTFEVSDPDGNVVYAVHPVESVEDFEPGGEYCFENLSSVLEVRDASGAVAFTVAKPERCADPFDSLTFAEFVDRVPLRKVGSEWLDYAGKMQYYEVPSENLNYVVDIYTRFDKFSYRIARPGEWDDEDREVYSAQNTKVATMTISSLVSDKTGKTVAKLYSDPDALYAYQLFDNKTGAYQVLTHYSNDMVVVTNSKGNVVCYVMPNGEYRGPTWYFFGYVTAGNKVVDANYDTLYTFRQSGGDWNIYDVDGELVGHLFSGTTPNNDWTIAAGHQRLFTFLANESHVVLDSDGNYVFTSKDGDKVVRSRTVTQVDDSGTLLLTILDENGDEAYRVKPTGNTYRCEAANGVTFDVAMAYETYSQGSMVLTRYWSVPYARMMYSCTNDQEEGTFDDDVGGTGGDGVPSPLSSSGDLAGGSGGGVSDTGSGVPDGGVRTLAATGTSSGSVDTGDSSGESSVQDIIDSVSDFFDGVSGILKKGNDTSKGEDLDPDNPLQISQTETDGRQLANVAFAGSSSRGMLEVSAVNDAYDYTQAITRLSKVYSSGRADYYKEAQEYNEVQTNRIAYKKSSIISTLNLYK